MDVALPSLPSPALPASSCGAWATSKASPVALTASAAPGASVALASRLLGLMSRAADPSSVGCCDFALAQVRPEEGRGSAAGGEGWTA